MTQRGTADQFEQLGTPFAGFHKLFQHRVQEVLLVCSLYESFILEEDGLVADLIVSEYQELNLSHAPRVSHVSNGQMALDLIRENRFDLVITMTRLGEWSLPDFAEAVRKIRPEISLIVLADDPRELTRCAQLKTQRLIDQVFIWHGDAKILIAIIKYVEDQLNAENDTALGNVRVIILIENSVRFYSSYLPLLYEELMRQTQALMAEGVNPVQKLLRMRARPKILLAETYEDAGTLYDQFSKYTLGIISDIRFPRKGKIDPEAGLAFACYVKSRNPQMPVLLQSSDSGFQDRAGQIGASFLDKRSRHLMLDLRNFVLNNFGFGDFVFRLPNGAEVSRASTLQALLKKLHQVPGESILFHASYNHFSNWLMARTEFELAARLRPRKVSEFEDAGSLRRYLIKTLTEFYERSQTGVIADFSRRRFSKATAFARIGGGSIGGKARGLAFINALLKRHNVRNRWPNVRVSVPNTAAIGTEVFDNFLDRNNLRDVLVQDMPDKEMAQRFLAGRLPSAVRNDLAAFLEFVKYPLAVRSSSLLEDSHGQPFAGIYKTFMIPNNHRKPAMRLQQLCNAIKLVYTSTYSRAAKHYQDVTGHHVEEEKMGVMLQEIVGSDYGDRFYPTFAGVARSYNFYPLGRIKPEDGVACVALGLGKMVVEGGEMLMFSPPHPGVLPQFSSIDDLFHNSQRRFFALDMRDPDFLHTGDEDDIIVTHDLEVAEADGTLAPIGSVYSAENDAVYDGIDRPGPRLVTFAHVLKSNLFPLADILKHLLDIGRRGMACPIEIEFAVNMRSKPMRFGVLQIRPTVTDEAFERISLEEPDHEKLVCFSSQTMGNGHIRGLRDVIYVKPDAFDSGKTRQIAQEVGRINQELLQTGRHYVLVGPGRWGSSDAWLGIPVTWEQISMAHVIVETALKDFVITPSQGSHFFQNLTSFRVGYLTVNPTAGGGFVNWDWLASCPAFAETEYLRHVRLDEEIGAQLDGRSRRGAIFKPGCTP